MSMSDDSYQRVVDELKRPRPRDEAEGWQRVFDRMDEACSRALIAAETWRNAAMARQATINRLEGLVQKLQAALDEAIAALPDDTTTTDLPGGPA